MNLLWTPLWSYIDLPDLFPISIFILILVVIIVYLRNSLIMVPNSNIQFAKTGTPQKVTLIGNPFTVSLEESNRHSPDQLKYGVSFQIKCQKPHYISHYWGTDITTFHQSVAAEWNLLKGHLKKGSFLKNSLYASKIKKREADLIGSTILIKAEKEITVESLGPSPRKCYPLVLVIFIDDSAEESWQDHDCIAYFGIVHVKDTVCTMETNIISHLVKQKNGTIINLQTVYTPETTIDEYSRNITFCVICQDNSVSHALLPCRHACVCGDCFRSIDKCPLCRSYIHSYFVIKQAQLIPEKDSSLPKSEKETSLRKRFTRAMTSIFH